MSWVGAAGIGFLLLARMKILNDHDGDAVRQLVGEAHGAVDKGSRFDVWSNQVRRESQ
jgi:hypothetical protein